MYWGSSDPREGNLFQIQDPHQHSALRRKTAHAYSMSSVVSYERHVDDTNEELLQRLGEFAASGETCNIVSTLLTPMSLHITIELFAYLWS